MPILTKEKSETNLSPNCKSINQACHCIEWKKFSVKTSNIFRAPLPSNSNDTRKCSQDHEWEVDNWQFTRRLALSLIEIRPEVFGTLSNTSLVEQKQRCHANLALLLIFKKTELAPTWASKTLHLLFVRHSSNRTFFVAASSKVELKWVISCLSARLASCYFTLASFAWWAASQTDSIHWSKPVVAECNTHVVLQTLCWEWVILIRCLVQIQVSCLVWHNFNHIFVRYYYEILGLNCSVGVDRSLHERLERYVFKDLWNLSFLSKGESLDLLVWDWSHLSEIALNTV